MNTLSLQNMEDAQNLTNEFIWSLENLPNEVRHLLDEVQVKEGRVQELQHQIDIDSARFIRHNISAGYSASTNQLPSKIAASYAEIQTISSEKILLCQRIIDLVTRTRARLDVELGKVRVLSGEEVPTASISASAPLYPDKRRKLDPSPPPLPLSRRATTRAITAPVVKAVPTTPLPAVRAPVVPVVPAPTVKVTKKKRDEPEEEEEDADDRNYCFCQKPSYGDMIACDNPACPMEWFHLSCVGMKAPLGDDPWFCSHCEGTGVGYNGYREADAGYRDNDTSYGADATFVEPTRKRGRK
ncbi:hypothetical protein C8J56DRAFT_395615 [Mycena floridula]|nr:hypothetical protein C8J56DRAFT_395615 [Mycena floridula]